MGCLRQSFPLVFLHRFGTVKLNCSVPIELYSIASDQKKLGEHPCRKSDQKTGQKFAKDQGAPTMHKKLTVLLKDVESRSECKNGNHNFSAFVHETFIINRRILLSFNGLQMVPTIMAKIAKIGPRYSRYPPRSCSTFRERSFPLR